jgi:hypothetical protein
MIVKTFKKKIIHKISRFESVNGIQQKKKYKFKSKIYQKLSKILYIIILLLSIILKTIQIIKEIVEVF